MNYRGVILGKLERFGEAIRAFDEILRIYPDMADAREKLEVLKSLENDEELF
jgi:hypothetical protein